MPVTKYKLYSLYINNVQIDANHISSFQITLEQDPNNATLPVGVCEIGIKNNSSYTFSEHNKIVVTFSCSVSGTNNIIYNFYISKIDRSNDKEITISGVDYIGLLDESNFEKAYKNPTAALSIISDILYDINGTYLSRISSDVNLTPVFEKMTKRQALQHVLFATGYRIRTNANQGNYDLEIYPESYESTAITVDDSVVYRGSSLVKNNEVNGVSITSHDYKLDDFGTVVVGEERFKDKSKVRNLSRTSDIENIITVSGAVCIQETRLNDVALRIYNDYQRYQDLNFDYVWCGEHIGKKLTIEAEDGMHTGFLKKLFLDVGLLSVVASGSMVLPNNNIVSPTDTETQSVTSTGSISNEVTYSELVALVQNQMLVPGAKYTITDYVTIVDNYQGTYDTQYRREFVRSLEHPFKLIVEALSRKELKEEAYAERADNDTYFSNSDLSKWKIKYDINNDATKYKWASPNGKGVIYEMIDDFNNKCCYDFKNIQYKRFKITSKWSNAFFVPPDDFIGQYAGCYIYYQDDFWFAPFFWTGDQNDYTWKFTFSDGSNDYSLTGNVRNNIIDFDYDQDTYLPNIVFEGGDNGYYPYSILNNTCIACKGVTIGKGSSNYNTFTSLVSAIITSPLDSKVVGSEIYATGMLSTNINGSRIAIYAGVENCDFIYASNVVFEAFGAMCKLYYTDGLTLKSVAWYLEARGWLCMSLKEANDGWLTNVYIYPETGATSPASQLAVKTLSYPANTSVAYIYKSGIVYK